MIEAGLDIVLHCNGTMEEARAVASVTPELSGVSLRRAKVAEAATKRRSLSILSVANGSFRRSGPNLELLRA